MDNTEDLHITDGEIKLAEQILLPEGCCFSDEAKAIIRCMKSAEVVACPGSGKTTVTLAKLKIFAEKMSSDDGAGICVLSHTNVAVNEIKAKMGETAEKLLSPPNFVGTIQEFMDQFLVAPFLRGRIRSSIRPMEDQAYNVAMYNLIMKDEDFARLRNFLARRSGYAGGRRLLYYLGNIRRGENGLYKIDNGASIAGVDTGAYRLYGQAVIKLLSSQGAMRFTDSHKCAMQAIENWNAQFPGLFAKKFKYVFIDEYQDCSKLQRDVLDKVFPVNECAVFKIGDVDQSIFNNSAKDELWRPSESRLCLSCSNRYSQEIADVVTCLRADGQKIESSRGKNGYKPCLIVFGPGKAGDVVGKFSEILDEKGFCDTEKVYKAIGRIKNKASKMNIGSYWSGYNNSNSSGKDSYWSYVRNIREGILCGEVFFIDKYMKGLICEILRFSRVRNGGRLYYTDNVEEFFVSKGTDKKYRLGILQLATLDVATDDIDDKIRHLIEETLGVSREDNLFEKIPNYFMKGDETSDAAQKEGNIYVDKAGRKIVFSTIHGVKGETHDVTLVLETEHGGKKDLELIVPFLEGGTPDITPDDEYIRRCVYVGMSRPRDLLCVAMTKETYSGHEKAFLDAGWEIYMI